MLFFAYVVEIQSSAPEMSDHYNPESQGEGPEAPPVISFIAIAETIIQSLCLEM